jgi:hypothetical protein
MADELHVPPLWTADFPVSENRALTIDDGCFVLLALRDGWLDPVYHIDREAARRIAELLPLLDGEGE